MELIHPPAWSRLLIVVLWPSIAIGAASALLWRRLPPGRAQTTLQLVGSIALLGVPMLLVVPWARASTLVVYQHAILSIWCLLMAVVLPFGFLRSRRNNRERRSGLRGSQPLLVAAGSLVLGVALGSLALGDILGEPVHVDGIVENVEHRTGSPPVFLQQPDEVTINGDTFSAAGELWRRLEPGMRVRGEALPRTRTLIRTSVGPTS